MYGSAPILAGEGFVLTPPTTADIPTLVEACTEAEAVSSLNVPQPYTIADAEAYVRSAQDGDGGYFWAIREQEGRPLAGMVVLRFLALPPPSARANCSATTAPAENGAAAPPTSVADIGGIYLLPPYRSKGIATRAARLVASWAFERGFDVLQWECLAANTSSVAVAERIGMVFYKDGWSSSQYAHHQNKRARWARMERSDLR